ncbi:MAG: 3-phosphoshikimate 1-carboxyvinyltransferase [Bacteroidetes bacterium]|nr:3-phosphoshikimate 1-carboxyvinyltransferase [Bacteroidota bacterium]
MDLLLKLNNKRINKHFFISGSKSITNRLYIIKALGKLNLNLINESNSEDSELLKKALFDINTYNSKKINVNHAGTDMRFLTAYLACTEGEWILTGSDSLKKRPIKDLVDCLKSLGAQISYLEKEGFPPLQIIGKKLEGGNISIKGNISSQYISAILLVAPYLNNKLSICIEGEIASKPYINMTINLMKQFGVNVNWVNENIVVEPSEYKTKQNDFSIESDWSSVSYWYSIAALSNDCELILNEFSTNSLQADSVLPKIYSELGVNTKFNNNQIILTKNKTNLTNLNYDFSNCPDIAQTIAATCVGLNITCNLTGLKTLKIKETDRIQALKNELEKFGVEIEITDESLKIVKHTNSLNKLEIETYHDHRMAMCIAPLALKFNNIQIKNAEVVNKSYPKFWEDFSNL